MSYLLQMENFLGKEVIKIANKCLVSVLGDADQLGQHASSGNYSIKFSIIESN